MKSFKSGDVCVIIIKCQHECRCVRWSHAFGGAFLMIGWYAPSPELLPHLHRNAIFSRASALLLHADQIMCKLLQLGPVASFVLRHPTSGGRDPLRAVACALTASGCARAVLLHGTGRGTLRCSSPVEQPGRKAMRLQVPAHALPMPESPSSTHQLAVFVP